MQETYYPDVEADEIKYMTADDLMDDNLFAKIMTIKDATDRAIYENKLKIQAKKMHVSKEFNDTLKQYKFKAAADRGINKGHTTNFVDQPIQLKCGEWICDTSGVRKNSFTANNGEYKTEYASPIPLLVTEILENMDEGTEKLRLAYYKNGWKTILCNRSTAASASKIIELADKGIEVNSDNAKLLVRYIADLIALNLDTIPRNTAVNHMGWIESEFMPYTDNYKFDGEDNYRAMYESIRQKGDYNEWIDYTHELRKNKLLRLQMAASFVSPLLKKVNALPFVIHYWGKTGSGKTVGLMVAMSIWGSPQKGDMWRTLNNTPNYAMQVSAFMKDLPVGLDELQTIKQFHVSYDNLVMCLTEGIDRGRMYYNKTEKTKTWDCSYIFTGEEPLTKENSGGGTQNRVIEVECSEINPVIIEGNKCVDFIVNNFGHAGPVFVEYIKNKDLSMQYKEIYNEILNNCDTTEKQAMAMACILLGDKLSCECIYTTENPLDVEDIKEYLKTNNEVSIAERAYDWVLDFIAINHNKFFESETGEIWGKIDDTCIYVNKNILTSNMSKNGFEFDAVKNEWATKKYLIKNTQNRLVHNTMCFGIKANYIKLKQKIDIPECSEKPPF